MDDKRVSRFCMVKGGHACFQLLVLIGLTLSLIGVAMAQQVSRSLSVENQILLNRLTLSGHRTIQVMLACEPKRIDQVLAATRRLRGESRYVDRTIGYLRVELPLERFSALISNSLVDAFQIATEASTGWHHDIESREMARSTRDAEAKSPIPMPSTASKLTLPLIDPNTARQRGFTADDGMEIKKWLADHPTFDGRGVTIALLESAQPEFSHPSLGTARTLDGKEVSKLAGIISSVGSSDYDDTRVCLSTEIDGTSKWMRIGSRTYILPHPGKYLFGIFSLNAGGNLVQQFGIVRSLETGEIWVDTDGDADFSNEKPLASVDQKFDVRSLKVTAPRKIDLNFVIASDKNDLLHLYYTRYRHQAMTLGIAAGSANAASLSSGVAPSARVLLVRVDGTEDLLPAYVEGYLTTAARPDVDLMSDSWGIWMLPDTQRDFIGLIFGRIVKAYKKPIFHAGGNRMMQLNSVSPLGDVFTVGGMISPATFAAFYGGGQIPESIVHPSSSAGPGVDGAMKPDFLAPEEGIGAALCSRDDEFPLPKNEPKVKLPPCYQVSGGTSSASPFAAGIAALLISAAKQSHTDYSVENLGRALKNSARFLANQSAYEQGTGVLNIEGAWSELRRAIANPQITVTTSTNNYPLNPYSNSGKSGPGIYETEAWAAGSTGKRTLTLRRNAGSSTPTEYRISWTGNDGSFSTSKSIVLPLGQPVSLTVTISPRTATIHSAILNLHELTSDAIVSRTLHTIIVPERLNAASHSVSFNSRIGLMKESTHFWYLEKQTALLSFDLTVRRGAVRASIIPPHTMDRHRKPLGGTFTFTKGTYHFDFVNPNAGTWNMIVRNDTAESEPDQKLVSTEEAEYSLTVSGHGASFAPGKTKPASKLIVNQGSKIAEPVVRQSWAKLTSYQSVFDPNGVRKGFEINVAPDSSALIVDAKIGGQTSNNAGSAQGLDLYLYECTTGECFLYDPARPAAEQKQIVVRNPVAGRWVAMVGAPLFPANGSFTVDAFVVAQKGSKTIILENPLAVGEERSLKIENAEPKPFAEAVHVYELFDEALERAQSEHPWGKKADLDKLQIRPAAIAIAIEK